MEIRDKAAIVTGGASGLGAAAATRLAEAGARVAILDRDQEKARALAVQKGHGELDPIHVAHVLFHEEGSVAQVCSLILLHVHHGGQV